MVEPLGTVARFGGHDVHWRERQGDGPPIVLMAGCGLAMEFWRQVSLGLPERHVVAYDRPGMGGTTWPGHLPRLATEVATLRDLVATLGDEPVVLVAHSMAAFHAEAFAREHPEMVRGLVIVDGSVEEMSKRPRPASPVPARTVARLVNRFRLGGVASSVWRWGTWVQSHHDYRQLGQGRIPAIYRDADSLAMATAEAFAYPEQAWDLLGVREQHPWPSGIRAVVLSAAEGEANKDAAGQEHLAQMLGAEQVTVAGSKHLMMLDRPDAIIAAVNQVAGCRHPTAAE